MNNIQEPAGQLDLSGTPSLDEPEQLTSYRELFFNDNAVELNDNGQLQDIEELVFDGDGNPVFETDVDGNLLLDNNGDPIQQTRFITVNAVMSSNGAIASSGFFDVVNNPGETVDHRGFLSNAELKLLSEWLDIGGQYLNNPFVLDMD